MHQNETWQLEYNETWPFAPSTIVPNKIMKIGDHDQNLASFEGGQQQATCQIRYHSIYALPYKYPETSSLTRSLSQN